MKKRFMSLLLVLLLALGIGNVANATGQEPTIIVDEPDVLNEEQENELSELAEKTENTYGIQAVYLFVTESGGQDNETYVGQLKADYKDDCVIMLENAENNMVYVEAFGKAREVIGAEECTELLSLYNEPPTYYEGIKVYLERVEQFFADAGVTKSPEETPTEVPAETAEERLLSRLEDKADILDETEENELRGILDEISVRQQFDVVIAIVEDYEQSDVKNAAYDYYDYNGFGQGEENDGVLLYLSMSDRQMNLAGTGFGIQAFTDYGRKVLIEDIKPELADDDYYAAFKEYAETCDTYITLAKEGTPFDVGSEDLPMSRDEKVKRGAMIWLISMAVSFIISTIVVGREKAKLKTVAKAVHADDYIRKGSLNLSYQNDLYLYTNVIRKYNPKKKDDDSDGGSTVDYGSSGVAHSSTSSSF